MYRILIVDDGVNERNGIKGLIKKFNYPLEVKQAKNGKEALSIIKKENIDILLTDIKMPFISGIELIGEIQKIGLNPICIIYSAYGEFEYAQNAIKLGVLQYLLKPINLEDFKILFDNVINLCRQKEYTNIENKKIMETLQYIQNEKYCQKILGFLELDNYSDMEDIEKIFSSGIYYPIIISAYSNKISNCWEDYKNNLIDIVGDNSIIINKNDMQILLLVNCIDFNSKKVSNLCEKIIKVSRDTYNFEIFIVVGNLFKDLKSLKIEYSKMVEHLDYQFFINESVYFIYNEKGVIKKTYKMLSLYFERILTFAKLKDYEKIYSEFELAFEYVEKSEGFSSIYIKYNFCEIIKKCCEILGFDNYLMEVIEKVYGANSILELKNAIFDMLNNICSKREENLEENRLIIMAKNIVQEEFYDCNLNVSYIADKMSMSSAYLSTLFKTETKQNLAKYISTYRLEKAKDLLKTTNMKVSDIAKKVGYVNSSYFIAIFKNNVGCSPVKYRENFFKNE